MRWTFNSRQHTPTQVATRYIGERFEEPRKILGGGVSGQWVGHEFSGFFFLLDGHKEYRITCDASATWTVWPIE